MLTLYMRNEQMTGVLNLAVVSAAMDRISDDSSQANRKRRRQDIHQMSLSIYI